MSSAERQTKRRRLMDPDRVPSGDVEAISPQIVSDWASMEADAEAMIPLIGNLYRRQNVVPAFFGKTMVHQSTLDIIKLHSFALKHLDQDVTVHNSLLLLQAIAEVRTQPTRFDVGRASILCKELLTREGRTDAEKITDLRAALAERLTETHELHPCRNPMLQARSVVLYGFGRIGRLLARILIAKTGGGGKLMVRAIVVRPSKKSDLAKRASLLRRDSVHGPFAGTIAVDEKHNIIIANGTAIKLLYSTGPDKLDYTEHGIHDAIVIDNTGSFRTKETLALHLKSPGVSKVVLTAPADGAGVTTVVAGVNDDRVNADDSIYSAASCTTNAIVPVLKVLDDAYSVVSGHVETIHSFTNDQNLIDNYHSKERRGRSAVLNMVITETGAAKAVTDSLPSFKNKLTANAIRVPTPNVSLAILAVTVARPVSQEEVNTYLRQQSLEGPLHSQIDFTTSSEVVSSDFVGNRHAGIVDAGSTIVNADRITVYVWYDNEFGYSCQVVRLVQHIAGIEPTLFPPTELWSKGSILARLKE